MKILNHDYHWKYRVINYYFFNPLETANTALLVIDLNMYRMHFVTSAALRCSPITVC